MEVDRTVGRIIAESGLGGNPSRLMTDAERGGHHQHGGEGQQITTESSQRGWDTLMDSQG